MVLNTAKIKVNYYKKMKKLDVEEKIYVEENRQEIVYMAEKQEKSQNVKKLCGHERIRKNNRYK